MPKELVMRYDNGEVIVVWKPALCIHSGVCFRGLPRVFDPRRRPWITLESASTQEIVAQVARCPSGALSVVRRAEGTESDSPTES